MSPIFIPSVSLSSAHTPHENFFSPTVKTTPLIYIPDPILCPEHILSFSFLHQSYDISILIRHIPYCKKERARECSQENEVSFLRWYGRGRIWTQESGFQRSEPWVNTLNKSITFMAIQCLFLIFHLFHFLQLCVLVYRLTPGGRGLLWAVPKAQPWAWTPRGPERHLLFPQSLESMVVGQDSPLLHSPLSCFLKVENI